MEGVEPDDSTAVGKEDNSPVSLLACQKCNFPIALKCDIFKEKFDVWSAAVYTYELDVLDEDVACYSATNPGDYRFDVVRTKPTAWVKTRGVPTQEHTWFPGYGWVMANCAACGCNVGWGFHRMHAGQPSGDHMDEEGGGLGGEEEKEEKEGPEGKEEEKEDEGTEGKDKAAGEGAGETQTEATSIYPERPPQFYGLILTRLKPCTWPMSKVAKHKENIMSISAYDSEYTSNITELFRLLNSVPTALAVPYFPVIQDMGRYPAMRRFSGVLLRQAREMIQQHEQGGEQGEAPGAGGMIGGIPIFVEHEEEGLDEEEEELMEEDMLEEDMMENASDDEAPVPPQDGEGEGGRTGGEGAVPPVPREGEGEEEERGGERPGGETVPPGSP